MLPPHVSNVLGNQFFESGHMHIRKSLDVEAPFARLVLPEFFHQTAVVAEPRHNIER